MENEPLTTQEWELLDHIKATLIVELMREVGKRYNIPKEELSHLLDEVGKKVGDMYFD